jgi:hypothetical protein
MGIPVIYIKIYSTVCELTEFYVRKSMSDLDLHYHNNIICKQIILLDYFFFT